VKDIHLRIQIDYCTCSISLHFHDTRRSIGAPNKFTTSSQLKRYWTNAHRLICTDWSTSQLQPHQYTRSIIQLVFIHHHISFDPCALTDEYW